MDIIVLLISLLLILVGLILIILNFPGIWVVWLGIFVNSAYRGFNEVSIKVVVSMFLICILSAILDYAAIGFSSKKFGASKWGIVGAIAGMIIGGIVANFIGLIIGPFIGALLAELIVSGKGFFQSSKAGLGAVLGILLGIILDMTLAVLMVIVWVILIT